MLQTVWKTVYVVSMHHRIQNGCFILTDDVDQIDLISFFVGTDRFKQGDFAGVFSGVTEHHEQLVVDTPGSVCDQTVAFGMVVGIDRLDKTDGSDREQIIIVGGSNVFFCNMGDQTHIGFNQNPRASASPALHNFR